MSRYTPHQGRVLSQCRHHELLTLHYKYLAGWERTYLGMEAKSARYPAVTHRCFSTDILPAAIRVSGRVVMLVIDFAVAGGPILP